MCGGGGWGGEEVLNHPIQSQDCSPQLRVALLKMPFYPGGKLQVSVFENVISRWNKKSRQAITLPPVVIAKNHSAKITDHIVRKDPLRAYQ